MIVNLVPKPGFCVKSATLTPGLLPPPAPHNPSILEPAPGPIPIPKGLKVFVNIAWDPNVPPPPEGSEDVIQRAMQGEEVDEDNPSGWYVPVIVSTGRQDTDKAGSPSLVFDCIYNSTVKSRTLRDPEFKIFLIELALQRIEAQTGLSLSRSIGTPNIASKGKLLPRTAHIPAVLLPPSDKSPLIQEISPSTSSTKPQTALPSTSGESTSLPGLRGILKSTPIATATSELKSTATQKSDVDHDTPLDWSWTTEESSGRLRIEVRIPGLTPPLVASSTLDISPRSIILSVPHLPTLDINLGLSDAEIAARVGASYRASETTSPSSPQRRQEATTRTLQLKRQRDFDVDLAEAEWKIGSGVVEILV